MTNVLSVGLFVYLSPCVLSVASYVRPFGCMCAWSSVRLVQCICVSVFLPVYVRVRLSFCVCMCARVALCL